MKERIPIAGPGGDFGYHVTLLMRRRGLTNKELARLAGVPPSTLSEWRHGASPRDYRAVQRIATVLGTSLERLLTGGGPGDPP